MPIHDHLDLILDEPRGLTDEDIRKLKEAAKGFPHWRSVRRMIPKGYQDFAHTQPTDFRLTVLKRRDGVDVTLRTGVLPERPLWAQLLLLAE
jgi:hypothetical protein